MGTRDIVEEALHHHIALLETIPLLPIDKGDHILLYFSTAWEQNDMPTYEVHYALYPEALRLEYAESYAKIGEYVPVCSYDVDALRDVLKRRNGPLWDTLEREVEQPLIRRPSRDPQRLEPHQLPEIAGMGISRYWAKKLGEWRSVVPGEVKRIKERCATVVNLADWKRR